MPERDRISRAGKLVFRIVVEADQIEAIVTAAQLGR